MWGKFPFKIVITLYGHAKQVYVLEISTVHNED